MHSSVSFYTLGCKLNHVETASISRQFLQHGFRVVEFGERADVIIINSCTVTTSADSECRQIISRAKKTSPDSAIIVTGCYAERDPKAISAIDGVSAVVGNSQKHRLAEIVLQESVALDESNSEALFVPARSMGEDNRTRAFLKIQDGCDYTCSFCTIPKVRGPARAMSVQEVERELSAMHSSGCHEVVLTGINLGAFKAPSGERLIDVLRLIEDSKPPFRVRISSIEPNTVTQEIIDLVARSQVLVPHFHIPLQSGSAEILRLMKRRYNPSGYSNLVHRIKESMPHAAVGIDVITGFPGETDSHFEETYIFLASLPLSYLHVFTYSERPGTPAAKMTHKIPERVRKQRTARLRTLSALKRKDFYYSQIGTTHSVIAEHFSSKAGGWLGWTGNYVRSIVRKPATWRKHPTTILLSEDTIYDY